MGEPEYDFDESQALPPSPEVLTEMFFDKCAWMRDHDWSTAPDHLRITIEWEMPVPAKVWDPQTGEIRDQMVDVLVEVQRYADGTLHIHAPGVCSDVDPEKLEEKRPS